jgi:uncharacterized coiled-coil protein SlyX
MYDDWQRRNKVYTASKTKWMEDGMSQTCEEWLRENKPISGMPYSVNPLITITTFMAKRIDLLAEIVLGLKNNNDTIVEEQDRNSYRVEELSRTIDEQQRTIEELTKKVEMLTEKKGSTYIDVNGITRLR